MTKISYFTFPITKWIACCFFIASVRSPCAQFQFQFQLWYSVQVDSEIDTVDALPKYVLNILFLSLFLSTIPLSRQFETISMQWACTKHECATKTEIELNLLKISNWSGIIERNFAEKYPIILREGLFSILTWLREKIRKLYMEKKLYQYLTCPECNLFAKYVRLTSAKYFH